MLASSLAIPCKKACMWTNYPNPAEERKRLHHCYVATKPHDNGSRSTSSNSGSYGSKSLHRGASQGFRRITRALHSGTGTCASGCDRQESIAIIHQQLHPSERLSTMQI